MKSKQKMYKLTVKKCESDSVLSISMIRASRRNREHC